MIKLYESGITVRSDEVRNDIFVDYSTLNSKGQRRLFLENKNLFLFNAIYSEYKSIQRLARKHLSECSSNVLDRVLIHECFRMHCDENLVLTILDLKNLNLKSATREYIALHGTCKVKLKIAKDKRTPTKLLNTMLVNEVSEFLVYNYIDIINAIALNPNFKMTKALGKKLRREYAEKDYLKIVKRIEQVRNAKQLEEM